MTRSNVPGTWGQPVYPNTSKPDFGGDLTDLAKWTSSLLPQPFANMLALSSATGMEEGYLATIATLPGAIFRYTSAAWLMTAPGYVASIAARDAAFSGGTRGAVNGDQVYVTSDPTAGNNVLWTRTGGAWRRPVLTSTGVYTGTVNSAGSTTIAHGLPGTPNVQLTQIQHPSIDVNSRYFETILWNTPGGTTFSVRNIDRRDNTWAVDQAVRFSWLATLPSS